MSDDMHSLLGKFFSGHATEEEAAAVNAWKLSGKENEDEYRLLEKLWAQSGKQTPIAFDTLKAWQSIDAKINAPKQAKVVRFPVKRIAIAAAACLLLSIGIWWMINGRTNTHNILAETDNQKIELSDGSKVYLRKGASLVFPEKFESNSRHVTLKGEGFFEVTPDKAKPFLITASETEVKVVGTSFTVNTNNDKVELIVKTGVVNFGAAADTIHHLMVNPGERALFENGTVSKQANADPNFNAWQSGKLVFNKTPLREVLVTMSNYYHVRFVMEGENKTQLETTGVTASFDNESLPAAINELSMITTFTIRQLENGDYQVSLK
ncbi:MAG: FecR domain-containing protein [Chitinophagaceae bacterium]